jgi:hypothetical protein
LATARQTGPKDSESWSKNKPEIINNNTIITGSTTATTNLRNALREGILNQLLHKISLRKIPLTKFPIRRISNATFVNVAVVIPILWTIWSLIALNNNNCSQGGCLAQIPPFFKYPDWIDTMIWVVLTIVAIFAISRFFILKFARHGKLPFSKIKIADAELSFFDGNDDSIFDTLFDEIFYLVNKSGAEVFVFEDLDRFADIDINATKDIFVELRALNNLINEKICVGKRKHQINIKTIKFLYAVKDNLLSDLDGADNER